MVRVSFGAVYLIVLVRRGLLSVRAIGLLLQQYATAVGPEVNDCSLVRFPYLFRVVAVMCFLLARNNKFSHDSRVVVLVVRVARFMTKNIVLTTAFFFLERERERESNFYHRAFSFVVSECPIPPHAPKRGQDESTCTEKTAVRTRGTAACQ